MTAYAARIELARERAGLETVDTYRTGLSKHAAEFQRQQRLELGSRPERRGWSPP